MGLPFIVRGAPKGAALPSSGVGIPASLELCETRRMDGATNVYSRPEVVDHYRTSIELQPAEAELFAQYVHPNDRVLDLGIGAGRTTRYLADRQVYVGLDIVELMVATAKQDLNENRLLVASADRLPFREGAFDFVVFSFNGIDSLPTREEVYAEVGRVLGPGGTFLFSVHNARLITSVPPLAVRGLLAWLSGLPSELIRAAFSKRTWFGHGELKVHGSKLRGLRVSCCSRRRIVAALRAHGFEIMRTVSAPFPGRPSALTPWYYYAAQAHQLP
jgi:SAM-dependent methyltransferase